MLPMCAGDGDQAAALGAQLLEDGDERLFAMVAGGTIRRIGSSAGRLGSRISSMMNWEYVA